MSHNIKKVLIVGPSWLGDMIMTQALFKVLHKQGKTIDVLAPKWNHAVLDCMPEVNKAIEMPFDHGDLKFYQRYLFAKSLKNQGYDQSIVIPNSFKSALIPYWAGIPVRTGWLGELRYGVLNNYQKLDKNKLPLMVQRLIALGYFDQGFKQENINDLKYDYPELQISDKLKQEVKNTYNLSDTNILVLAPGAAFGPAKKWPEQYFSAVAKEKIKQGWQVVLLGSAQDRTVTTHINQALDNKAINLAGQLILPETVAIISLANCLVSNDSGLLHVAAALQIPLVGIYGSTSPGFTPPLISDSKKAILEVKDLACKPCFAKECKFGHYKCLNDIKPELVLESIENFK